MCDVAGKVGFDFVHLNQTGKTTQLINATYAPHQLIACDGTLQTWSATVQVIFPFSGRLHKGKAGVTVQFVDSFPDTPHIAFATVFIK